jgi:DNA-binding transcriptional MerR regulator
MKGYTTREVAEVLGLSTSKILSWTRSGLLTPQRGSHGAYLFSFQDIVLLRTARELLAKDVPARRVREALEALQA